jgi:hypothetical protein
VGRRFEGKIESLVCRQEIRILGVFQTATCDSIQIVLAVGFEQRMATLIVLLGFNLCSESG